MRDKPAGNEQGVHVCYQPEYSRDFGVLVLCSSAVPIVSRVHPCLVVFRHAIDEDEDAGGSVDDADADNGRPNQPKRPTDRIE